jgi:hypothetical protein
MQSSRRAEYLLNNFELPIRTHKKIIEVYSEVTFEKFQVPTVVTGI